MKFILGVVFHPVTFHPWQDGVNSLSPFADLIIVARRSMCFSARLDATGLSCADKHRGCDVGV